MKGTGQYDLFSKKEVARYERERKKLEKNLSGIKEMAGLPDALFVIDTKLEEIAVKEAKKLGIPVIGVADTNCDPDDIDFIIPGNDDALRSIRLITNTVAQAYMDGRALYEAQQREAAEQMEKQRQAQSAAAAAARAAAEAAAREGVPAAEVVEAPAPESGKPKTTVRKALQRKPRPVRREADGRAAEASVDAVQPPAEAAAEEAPLAAEAAPAPPEESGS